MTFQERDQVSDPAFEAARRAAEKIMVCGLGSPLYPSDLLLAAREALAPLRELHKPTTDEYGNPGRICDDCEWEWPCPTAKLIYREDEL